MNRGICLFKQFQKTRGKKWNLPNDTVQNKYNMRRPGKRIPAPPGGAGAAVRIHRDISIVYFLPDGVFFPGRREAKANEN
jgi:hypothetical protein